MFTVYKRKLNYKFQGIYTDFSFFLRKMYIDFKMGFIRFILSGNDKTHLLSRNFGDRLIFNRDVRGFE